MTRHSSRPALTIVRGDLGTRRPLRLRAMPRPTRAEPDAPAPPRAVKGRGVLVGEPQMDGRRRMVAIAAGGQLVAETMTPNEPEPMRALVDALQIILDTIDPSMPRLV